MSKWMIVMCTRWKEQFVLGELSRRLPWRKGIDRELRLAEGNTLCCYTSKLHIYIRVYILCMDGSWIFHSDLMGKSAIDSYGIVRWVMLNVWWCLHRVYDKLQAQRMDGTASANQQPTKYTNSFHSHNSQCKVGKARHTKYNNKLTLNLQIIC